MLISILGCGRSDSVLILKSPIEGLFYTVETSKASGPTSDTTRVYAHLERGGKSKKTLVLDGLYITVSKVSWGKSHDANLCLRGGITSTFRN